MKEKRRDTFRKSFQPLLVFSQFCGLLPLTGVFGRTHGELGFTWSNPMHLYALIISAITLFFDVCFTRENFKSNVAIDNFASTVFFTVCLLTSFLFLSVARHFPDVAIDFERIEKSMTDYESPRGLGLRVKLFMIGFCLLATAEHGTMGVLHFSKALEIAGNGTGESFGRAFYVMHFPAIALVVPYSGILTFVFFWANAVCTFNWNNLDFFLVGISLEITAKFNQINDRLISSNHEKEDPAFWKKVYDDYDRVVLLTKKLDKILAGIIITTFFSNLYHLSLQLLRSLKISGTVFHRIYFYFSLSYLLLRFMTTLICLSRVNDASKKSADFLFSLGNHCISSLRLLHRIITDDVHFTGNRLFPINRSFIVSVIGTILTYQTVLLQFNSLKYVD